MPDESLATNPLDQTPAEGESPRWSPWRAFFTAGFCPKRTAMRTNHVGLARAFVVYCVAFLLTAMLVSMFDNWRGEFTIAEFDRATLRMGRALFHLGRDLRNKSLMTTAAILGIFVGISAASVLVAVILSSWGARDEPLRASFAASVRRTWLYSPHALLVILLPGIAIGTLERLSRDWRNQGPQAIPYPTPPTKPLGQPTGSPAWQDYEVDRQEYLAKIHAYDEAIKHARDNPPWHTKYGQLLCIGVVLASGVWAVWAWLRSVGAPRGSPPIERPPTCEFCGYNLSHTPPDSRCPECGEAVEASFGPDVRQGSLWERRGETGWLRAWWRCWFDPLLRPRAFGRSLAVSEPTTAHRPILAATLLLVGLTAGVGMAAVIVADFGWDWNRGSSLLGRDFHYSIVAAFAGITGGIALLVSFAAATLAGIWFGLTEKRNLLPASAQAMAYSGAYLVLWTAITFGTSVIITALEDPLRALSRAWTSHSDLLALAIVLVPQAVLLVGYLSRIFRITAACKYANR